MNGYPLESNDINTNLYDYAVKTSVQEPKCYLHDILCATNITWSRHQYR